MKYLSFIILMVLALHVSGQTKKIANASHASSGPTFNWSSSDNLGAIMHYEKIQKINIPAQKIKPQTLAIDTVLTDSVTTPDTAVYEKVSENHTLIIEEAHPVELERKTEVKSNTGLIKSTKTNKVHKRRLFKRKKKTVAQQLNVKAEVRQVEPEQSLTYEAGYKWLSLLLLIPIGLLMVKKP